VSGHIAMRSELRDTYLTKNERVSGNVLGPLAGVSVFTR
jgi:hypothetical protein